MALDGNIIKERLKETFNGESQETVAAKLNMTQGSISKLLTGKQVPTLETLYHIADIYGVSIDWITGLSEEKDLSISKTSSSSYCCVVGALSDLFAVNGIEIIDNSEFKDRRDTDKEVVLRILDPLTNALFTKSLKLFDTDPDLYKTWRIDKLTAFEDRELIEEMVWQDHILSLQTKNEMSESAWLKIHDKARELRKEFLWLYEEGSGIEK